MKNNLYKRILKNIVVAIFTYILIIPTGLLYAENITNSVYSIDPYYNYWKNEFIVYVDNYSGDINNVSANDLTQDKGSSRVYLFTKLTNGNYTYDDLLADIKNTDETKNLHDTKPILVLLPKSAKNHESHAKLKDENEKGKLVSGGPYSKYAKLQNGFYYKDAKLDKESLNKVLSEYKTKSNEIYKKLQTIKSLSIKDLYNNVHVAYMTNGASNVAGTADSKIYLLDVDKKHSPYKFSITNLISDNVITGINTKDFLPTWIPETIYIYDNDNKLIDSFPYESLQQYIFSKQDKELLDWLNSLNN